MTVTNMLLIRITIAKILDMDRTLDILRHIPLRPEIYGWDCRSWVQEAIETLDSDGDALGIRVMDWDKVSQKAVSYCDEKKAANRFCGEDNLYSKYPPTFDFTVCQDGKEVIC